MTRTKPSPESGFSLIELMVALLVTLVVSGAVFALMTAGQGAFRREPEITDRQQNIRMAMELIQRDIATAGVGIPVWRQMFTKSDAMPPQTQDNQPFLDGSRSTVPHLMGASGFRTDHLQLLGNSGECPDAPLDTTNPTNGDNLNLIFTMPSCYREDQMVLVKNADEDQALFGFAHEIHTGGTAVNFPPGQQPPQSELPGSPPWGAFEPRWIMPVNLVRYEIALEPGTNIPALYRSELGGINAEDGVYHAAPGIGCPGCAWELVARGIEDMQVRYRMADGTIDNCGGIPGCSQPARVVLNNWATITREVHVTLWARSTGGGAIQQGAKVAPGGTAPNALRERLDSWTTPRAMLIALQAAPAPFTWQ